VRHCGKRTMGVAAGRVRCRGDAQMKGGARLAGGSEGLRGFWSAAGMWLNGRKTRVDPYRTVCITSWADPTVSGLTGYVARSPPEFPSSFRLKELGPNKKFSH
jgi:hypothetical protein